MTLRQLLSVWLMASVIPTAMAGEVRHGGEGHAANPNFSADGKFIAFEVNNYGDRSDLFISSVAGDIANDGKKVNLPGGGGPFGGTQVVINPTWHPEGLAVFEGSNPGGQFRLYYTKPGSGSAAEMIQTTEVPGDLTFPVLNKDGSMMAFIADRTGNGDINTRDSNTARIEVKMESTSAEMFPQFDDAGAKILFTRKQNNAEDVFELTLSTGAETSVSGGARDQTRPVYASGGRVLFFDNSRDATEWDLATVAGAGGSKKILARGVTLPLRSRPAVSANGDWVGFTYEDPTKSSSVFLMKVDGSKTVEVKTEYTACGEPAIGTQGSKVVVAYTALPQKGAAFRSLYVKDVTSQL